MKIVITRHQPLVALLLERGIIGYVSAPNDGSDASDTQSDMLTRDYTVIAHATAEQIRGQHVVGVLPLHLAAECASVTEIPLALTPADRENMARGDLPISRMREIAGEPRTYVVRDLAHLRARMQPVFRCIQDVADAGRPGDTLDALREMDDLICEP